MCGLAGLWTSSGCATTGGAHATVLAMSDALVHRGPDDSGVWCDENGEVALAQRRLSIVDLSAAGHQPMVSLSGRFVLVFNGEIYNHLDLRSEVELRGAGFRWRGHSDTETLLAAVEAWGLDGALRRTVGMFAMALWDTTERTLHLARDRFGEKPLYYGWSDGRFLFASELKAFRAAPGFANPVSRGSLAQFMRFMAVPAPRSIYESVYKLEPGCRMTVRGQPPANAPSQPLRPGEAFENVSVERWWSLAELVQSAAKHQFTAETEAVDSLERALLDAIRVQSLADVPLGAFLSGGVDSSTIVALMQRQAARPVKTFTVGFEEKNFDEAPYARAVAHHLGTEHHELFVSAREAQDVIPRLPVMFDEPFADSSQIPTHLICRAARQTVTVALSGDAGDELFGGYNRYSWVPRIWRRIGWMPRPARAVLGAAIGAVPPGAWGAVAWPVNAILRGRHGIARLGEKAQKLGERLRESDTVDELYVRLVSEWQDPADVVKGEGGAVLEPESLIQDALGTRGPRDFVEQMMFCDSVTYLPDDILCKVDRAAMAVSLETRVPFLDHRVAEIAWRLPTHMKMREGQGKWALRQVLHRYVPRHLIERPKTGFAVPVGEWMRGPLRPWAEALLDENRLAREGYFHPAPIREKWRQHLSGAGDHTNSLWAVLMFQEWLASVQ
jgi:asparagine synthase (glutamine-hydrolysing)